MDSPHSPGQSSRRAALACPTNLPCSFSGSELHFVAARRMVCHLVIFPVAIGYVGILGSDINHQPS